jgi:hypothetical protein
MLQGHILDLRRFVVQEGKQGTLELLHDVLQVLGVQLDIPQVDLRNGQGRRQDGASKFRVQDVHRVY